MSISFFDDIDVFPFKDLIVNSELFFAHTKEGKNNELLEEHMDLCISYLLKITQDKNLDVVFTKIYKNIIKDDSEEAFIIYKELIYNAVLMHDIGKINIDFQSKKMNNPNFKKYYNLNTNHSGISSLIYISYFTEKISKMNSISSETKTKLIYLTFINGYIISEHHGNLSNFEYYMENFDLLIDEFSNNNILYSSYKKELFPKLKSKRFLNYIKDENKLENNKIDLYIYSKVLFSTVTTCDFYSTCEYMNDMSVDFTRKIDNVNKYYDAYKEKDFYKTMIKHKNHIDFGLEKVYSDTDINKLRAEMNIETEEVLLDNLDKRIFYLEAPTGSGKTITSANLALKILEKDNSISKLFYIFPFNTLIEQTNKTFTQNLFETVDGIKDDVAVINSITPIKITSDKNADSEDSNAVNYEQALLDRQFLHYPIVLTTNVGFFSYLFGTGREDSFPIMHLINSVVVLDEIQSYKNSIWKEIIMFLTKYADILNMKIIIMSATLPRLDELMDESGSFTYLIKDRKKYYTNTLFKDRVSVDYSMLGKGVINEDLLLEKIIDVYNENKLVTTNDNKILLECMKKDTALRLYEKLGDLFNNVFLITGDDNKAERKRILEKVEKLKDCILVSTQAIEAGVDIDMDIGFKDISILDSEEQFLGRINRSCKKSGCKAYFFNLDNIDRLYTKDLRKMKRRTLLDEFARNILKSKDFHIYYKDIIKDINFIKNGQSQESLKEFDNKLKLLNFKDIEKHMALIDKNLTSTIFLNTEVELDGEVIKGNEVWEEYKSLITNKNLDYPEKRVKLSVLSEKIDLFTYQVYKFPDIYDDEFGYLKYIDDGYKYMKNGKFDRDRYSQELKNGYSFI